MTCDLRTSIYYLNLELHEERSSMGWNLPEQLVDAIWEQQLRSGRNRGAAAEAGAIGEQLKRRRAAAEADTSSEQQLMWTQSGNSS